MVQPRFNYIITIHNKEELIEQVLMSVLMCCRDNSFIYPVLDGCTDHTEEIVDSIMSTYAGVPITKVHTSDVHELLSINAGLKASCQEGYGFNLILQDDVVLADFRMENKIKALYDWVGPKLGYVSMRMGANFARDVLSTSDPIPFVDYLENVYGHGIKEAKTLSPGYFAYRDIPIKSPVCIPFYLVRDIGTLEERLAPYGHDDPEYAVRCNKAGYRCGVFALRFFSDIRWGGTRINPHPELNQIIQRNMSLIRTLHPKELDTIAHTLHDDKIYEIPGTTDLDEEILGSEMREVNRERLEHYYGKGRNSWVSKFSNVVNQFRKRKKGSN